jgi:hypothetical protein
MSDASFSIAVPRTYKSWKKVEEALRKSLEFQFPKVKISESVIKDRFKYLRSLYKKLDKINGAEIYLFVKHTYWNDQCSKLSRERNS